MCQKTCPANCSEKCSLHWAATRQKGDFVSFGCCPLKTIPSMLSFDCRPFRKILNFHSLWLESKYENDYNWSTYWNSYSLHKFPLIELSWANWDKLGIGGIEKFLLSYNEAGLNSCWLSESSSSADDDDLEEADRVGEERLEFFEPGRSFALALALVYWSESGGQNTERWSHKVRTQEESLNDSERRIKQCYYWQFEL